MVFHLARSSRVCKSSLLGPLLIRALKLAMFGQLSLLLLKLRAIKLTPSATLSQDA